MSAGRIFISYRRGVDQGTTGRLYDRLERHYDSEQLFMDVDDIPLGRDFVEYLHEQVASCAVFVAVIGPGWVASCDRLADEDDFVRIEIEAALQRPHIPIIPVFIDGAGFPGRGDLPESLRPFRRRNGLNLRHDSFGADVDERLKRGLDRLFSGSEQAPLKAPAKAAAKAAPDTPKLPEPGTIFRDVDAPWCPEMVVIPTGSFMMGSTDEETTKFGVDDDFAAREKPRHRVEIAEPFALARYTTTFDDYDAFCDATEREKPEDEGWGRGNRPVINVSWEDAVAYCDWLSEQTGHAYRLPSEAEWEYACRAGTETAFSFGDLISTDLANYDGRRMAGGSRKGTYRAKTVPVTYPGFQPNGFGLHQMHGNVRQWCADDFVDSYETARSQAPLLLGPRGEQRVLRGGSWDVIPRNLRSASRGGSDPDNRFYHFGFRPARTLFTP